MLTSRILRIALLTAVVLVAVNISVVAQIPDQFTNLKVMSKDITKQDLVDAMKSFTFALGTRCWYCHEGEGDDLSTYDFASDRKPTKATARRHVLLTREVNQKYFEGKPAISCMTCHQGDPKPPR